MVYYICNMLMATKIKFYLWLKLPKISMTRKPLPPSSLIASKYEWITFSNYWGYSKISPIKRERKPNLTFQNIFGSTKFPHMRQVWWHMNLSTMHFSITWIFSFLIFEFFSYIYYLDRVIKNGIFIISCWLHYKK